MPTHPLALFCAVVFHATSPTSSLPPVPALPPLQPNGHTLSTTETSQRHLDRMGVILWAHGRSATDTIAHSFQRISKLPYCNNKKEGFKMLAKNHLKLNVEALRHCIVKRQLFTHVKPMHLRDSESYLRAPADFFRGAWDAGFRTVIASFRANQVAREVSAFELMLAQHHAAVNTPGRTNHAFENHLKDKTVIGYLQKQRDEYSEGLATAKELGYVVVELSFTQVTTELCESVNLVLAEMIAHRNVTGYYNTKTAQRCTTEVKKGASHNRHMRTSHHEASLAARLGRNNTKMLVDQLAGSEFEWMLDLSALSVLI